MNEWVGVSTYRCRRGGARLGRTSVPVFFPQGRDYGHQRSGLSRLVERLSPNLPSASPLSGRNHDHSAKSGISSFADDRRNPNLESRAIYVIMVESEDDSSVIALRPGSRRGRSREAWEAGRTLRTGVGSTGSLTPFSPRQKSADSLPARNCHRSYAVVVICTYLAVRRGTLCSGP